MGQAQRLLDQMDEIDLKLRELATEIRKAGTEAPANADLDEMMARLPFTREARLERELERQRLFEQRRNLQAEYDRLSPEANRDQNA